MRRCKHLSKEMDPRYPPFKETLRINELSTSTLQIAKEDLLDKIMSYGDAMTKEEVTECLRLLQGAKRDATYDEVL